MGYARESKDYAINTLHFNQFIKIFQLLELFFKKIKKNAKKTNDI